MKKQGLISIIKKRQEKYYKVCCSDDITITSIISVGDKATNNENINGINVLWDFSKFTKK